MNKSILIGLAVLTASTSAASAWTHQSQRNSHRIHHGSAYTSNMAAQRGALNTGASINGPGSTGYYGPGYARSGFWPSDVAGAAVGTAGAVAAGAVNTAGAIATAPFRGANSYAYSPTNSYAYSPANSYAMAPGGLSNEDHVRYMKNLHDSGYNPKGNFNASGNVDTKF